MKQILSLLLLLGLFATIAPAAEPAVATADCSDVFLIGGKSIPKVGVGNWPVFAGQTVRAVNDAVLLSMKDGSRVLLTGHSEATVLMTGKKVTLRLTKGSASYKMVNPGSLSFDIVEKGITNVIPESGMVTVQSGLTPNTVGYFALANRAAAPGSMPIVLSFTGVPSGVNVVPGPEPESSYRGTP